MCKRQVELFDKDADYLEKIRDKYGLRSKALALKLIIDKIKFMKVEGELR